MVCDTRKARAIVASRAWDGDSAYQSTLNPSSIEEADSSASSLDASFRGQPLSSITSLDSDQGISDDVMDLCLDMDTPRAAGPTTYQCIFKKAGDFCEFSSERERDWARHGESEKHFPQKRYMCIFCIDPSNDEEGNPTCSFCSAQISVSGNNKRHYLQCERAQKGRHIFAGAREEHFRGHLKKHGFTTIGTEQSTWTFDVASDWPRECGFCGDRFSLWGERTSHVAAHFRAGMDISSWTLPFSKARARDRRPGIDCRKRHDDNDDDEHEDNHFGGGSGSGRAPQLRYGDPFGSSGTSPEMPLNQNAETLSFWCDDEMLESELHCDKSKLKVGEYLQRQLSAPDDEPKTLEQMCITDDDFYPTIGQVLSVLDQMVKHWMIYSTPIRNRAFLRLENSLTKLCDENIDVDDYGRPWII